MPRVYLNEKDRLSDRLASWVYGQMKLNRITQQRLADELGISQQALGKKLKNKQFSYKDFITFVAFFCPDASELAWLVGKRGE